MRVESGHRQMSIDQGKAMSLVNFAEVMSFYILRFVVMYNRDAPIRQWPIIGPCNCWWISATSSCL